MRGFRDFFKRKSEVEKFLEKMDEIKNQRDVYKNKLDIFIEAQKRSLNNLTNYVLNAKNPEEKKARVIEFNYSVPRYGNNDGYWKLKLQGLIDEQKNQIKEAIKKLREKHKGNPIDRERIINEEVEVLNIKRSQYFDSLRDWSKYRFSAGGKIDTVLEEKTTGVEMLTSDRRGISR